MSGYRDPYQKSNKAGIALLAILMVWAIILILVQQAPAQ